MPLVKPGLDFVFGLKARLGEPVAVGETPEGLRRMVPIVDGSFSGRDFHGRLLGGGADWQLVRNDGVTAAEATYLLRTDDGVTIQVRNRGFRHGPAEVLQRLAEGDDVDPAEYYFRTTPTFLVGAGTYEWLNRTAFVATGARYARSIELWFYRVT
jgi:hypothetical protein